MNYTTEYNRGYIGVVHPQLNSEPGEFRFGRKRFDVDKNAQSSHIVYNVRKPVITSEEPRNREQYIEDLPSNPQKDYEQPTQSSYQPRSSSIPKNYSQLYDEKLPNYKPKAGTVRNNDYQYEDQSPGYTKQQGFDRSFQEEATQYIDPAIEKPHQEPAPLSLAEKYTRELEILKEQLRQKDEILQSFQQRKSPAPNISQEEAYNRLNKGIYDKVRMEEQRKETTSNLDFQLSLKEQQKQIQILEREKEQARRLEELKKLRDDEAYEREQKIRRAKQYRENLEVQELLKNQLKGNGSVNKSYVEEVSQFEINRSDQSLSKIESPSFPRYAKKNPRTITFDPITGALRDTKSMPSPFRPKQHSEPPKSRQIPSEFISHPAFNDVKFTKASPKFIPSFPVTGTPNAILYKPEFQEDANKFFGIEERGKSRQDKSLADYGNMVLGRYPR
ncbi:unnamed protein product [Blepharisma stoltei]|uniref:Uncharacterized protein n=1 Tax=Blepharisma stoltei TaxID=1481888 RepID=A0AAU9IW85_9CILI|nr:unnamed protein product [Blepharisma stoltei]